MDEGLLWVSELGYVVTNHVAQLVYEGVTNRMKLKTEKSDLAVWRESMLTNYVYPPGWNNLTNFYYPNPWVVTNPVIPYYPSNAPIYITNLEIFKNAFIKDPAWKYEKARY